MGCLQVCTQKMSCTARFSTECSHISQLLMAGPACNGVTFREHDRPCRAREGHSTNHLFCPTRVTRVVGHPSKQQRGWLQEFRHCLVSMPDDDAGKAAPKRCARYFPTI
jgi:hypothetical protein